MTDATSVARGTRTGVRVLFTCVLACAFTFATRGQDQDRAQAIGPVSRGLAFLARQQQPDGSFTGFDETAPRGLTASLAVTAFLSAGQLPGEGRYGLVVHNAIEYIVRYLPEDDDFGRADGSGTRGQAFITIALAQAWGTDRDSGQRPQIRAMLERSLGAILKSQDRRDPAAGGWPLDGQGEPRIYSTALMTLALQSLRDAGLTVPPEAFRRAAAFAQSCAAKDGKGYVERGAGQPTAAATSAAVIVLSLAHVAKPADMAAALGAVRNQEGAGDPFTTLYLGLVAARLCGDPAAWPPAWNYARDALQNKSKQSEDGSWFPPRAPAVGTGAVDATATAVMTLAIPYRVLPVYGAR